MSVDFPAPDGPDRTTGLSESCHATSAVVAVGAIFRGKLDTEHGEHQLEKKIGELGERSEARETARKVHRRII